MIMIYVAKIEIHVAYLTLEFFIFLNTDPLISVTNKMNDSYDRSQNKRIAGLPLSSLLDLPLSQIP